MKISKKEVYQRALVESTHVEGKEKGKEAKEGKAGLSSTVNELLGQFYRDLKIGWSFRIILN